MFSVVLYFTFVNLTYYLTSACQASTKEMHLFSHKNVKATRHSDIKRIEVTVADALWQLRHIAASCEKWHCLPSVSCIILGTKGASTLHDSNGLWVNLSHGPLDWTRAKQMPIFLSTHFGKHISKPCFACHGDMTQHFILYCLTDKDNRKSWYLSPVPAELWMLDAF